MKKHRLVNQLLVAALGLTVWTGSLSAAAPLAGTAIGNQAKATYTDTSNQEREVFSNTVTTTVDQVAAFTLVTDNQRNATPGSQVFFPHTLTNTGNGPDTFPLSLAQTGDFTLGNLVIYADADQDGLPDNFTPITTTGQLAPGAEFHFVVAGVVPGSANAGQTATATVTGQSQYSSETKTNNDKVTVVTGAVMQVNKAASKNSGTPGTTGVVYTITYTNNGNAAANNFKIRDPLPAHVTYVAGSGRWSVTGGTVLDDSGLTTQGTSPNAITYKYDSGTRTVSAEIESVPAGQSGFITFTVDIDSEDGAGAPLPPQVLSNIAYHQIDTETEFPTNTVPFTVVQVAGVTLDGDTVASAAAGSTVTFNNLLKNTGSGVDTFDITLVSNNFPAGTTFKIFQSDGQTPMLDSTGNGIPDTGPVAAGATYNVVIKATLPANAPAGGPYTLNKLATSTYDNAVSDDADDILTLITGASVDITNNDPLPTGLGEGAGPEAAPVVTNAANPGSTTRFTLFVNNTGPNPDSFNLDATNLALPAGWSVVFRDSNNLIVTGTGVIQPGASKEIYADVSIPANQAPGSVSIHFRAKSPSTNAEDIIHDAVAVNTIRKIEIVTNNSAQTFPGGAVVYEHVITNLGNVHEGDGTASVVDLSLTDSLVAQAWTSVIYWDKNNDGIIDPNDPVITNMADVILAGDDPGLAPGKSARLLVKVFAPLGATNGITNITTITATTTGDINGVTPPPAVSNQDVTTVVLGDLKVEKFQARVDASGDPIAPWTLNPLTAKPGESIIYQIRITNVGSADATAIKLYDRTPTHTTYDSNGGGVASVVGGSVATVSQAPADGAAGEFVFDVGTLAPTETATVQFGVKINPL